MVQTTQVMYYNYETTNMSFIDMFNYLKNTGRKNHSFHLVTIDPDLIGIDPRDPNLSVLYKAKVHRECVHNYWYFIREVVRIPVQGGDVSGGIRYKLHRGNMALGFLFMNNYNVFLELPRQNGKTTAALIYYLWVYNFASSNSEILFANKKHDDSKRALQDLKKYRDALPSYLQMSKAFDREGKQIKVPTTATFMENPMNGNKIRTAPGARTKQLANNLGRGCTMPLQYYDEFAWILYNKEIYMAAVPAFSTASRNAKMNRSPYGILITTTPGDLTTNEGLFAESMKNNATPWCEEYYDKTSQELETIRESNVNSSFFYVRYTYQQLGRGEEYFKQMVVDLLRDWGAIRREVLLEWTSANMNCPFGQEDLDVIKSLCKPPIRTLLLGSVGQFQMQVYEPIMNTSYPPIMGVDVSGGFQRDASAITVIDSKTTKVIATFNCNYISSPELARIIYEIVVKYMPTAIVNVERNGGFGSSVLAALLETSIKKNLYWEWKEQPLEQRYPGDNKNLTTVKSTVKSYGTNNTKDTRNKLIELLFERVELHKDKFNAMILHDEMEQMEVKKNGKIEHSSNSHDDQVFSYLMALYVWYYGVDVKRRFGITKTSLDTDKDLAVEYTPIEKEYGIELDIKDLNINDEDPTNIEEQLKTIGSMNSILYSDWEKSEAEKDRQALEMIKSNKATRQAYYDAYHPNSEMEIASTSFSTIPDSVFINFNNFDFSDNEFDNGMNGNLSKDMDNIGDFR